LSRSVQFVRECNAGCSRTNDADLGVQNGVRRNFICMSDAHSAFLSTIAANAR
jgi:hypothetical protein